jgi:ureidoglycolate hydrolase
MAEIEMATLAAGPLTAAAWAPFGWLPVDDSDPTDGDRTLHYEWGDPHLNVISHAPDEVDRTDGGLVCAGLYRHVTHTQALMSLDVPALLAVAAPGHEFAAPRGIDGVTAFWVEPLEPFVLFQGTWHWGPFPLGSEPVRLYNIQGRGFAEDNEYADLAALTGSVIEVRAA